MSAEKSGYNITVTCSQDSTIAFQCKAKKKPGVHVSSKLDLTTDASTTKTYASGSLLEVTDGELVVLDDPVVADKIIDILGVAGTITFTGKTTQRAVVFANAWFASYTPLSAGIDEVPTAKVVIESGGTLPA